MGIIGDLFSAAEVEARIHKLYGCINDLTNDKIVVGAYNKAVRQMTADVQGLLGADGSQKVVCKLASYEEPDENSDCDIINTKDYLQREINYLKGKTCGEAGGR